MMAASASQVVAAHRCTEAADLHGQHTVLEDTRIPAALESLGIPEHRSSGSAQTSATHGTNPHCNLPTEHILHQYFCIQGV